LGVNSSSPVSWVDEGQIHDSVELAQGIVVGNGFLPARYVYSGFNLTESMSWRDTGKTQISGFYHLSNNKNGPGPAGERT